MVIPDKTLAASNLKASLRWGRLSRAAAISALTSPGLLVEYSNKLGRQVQFPAFLPWEASLSTR